MKVSSFFTPTVALFFCLSSITFFPVETEGGAIRGVKTTISENEEEGVRGLQGSKGGKGKGKGGTGSKGAKGAKGSGSHSGSYDYYDDPLRTVSYGSGMQMVPIVLTAGKARLYLMFQKDFSYAYYKLEVANLQSITGAQLWCEFAGQDGQNGQNDAIYVLFSGTASNPYDKWATLAEGVITAADISNGFYCGEFNNGIYLSNLAGLFSAILKDQIAYEIDTSAYPNGEVRGQIVTVYNNLGVN